MQKYDISIYGLFAHPVQHSLSPLIHNTSFKKLDIPGIYLKFDIIPEHLTNAIAAIKALNIKGVNLSMPLKTAVIPFLDELTPTAQQLNCVNTIINQDGYLKGDTTDGRGLISSLNYNGIQVQNKTITVLGAGGAGRAIIAALNNQQAAKINVFKRKNSSFLTRQQQLESWSPNIAVIDYQDELALKESLEQSQIIINTTSLGMKPDKHLPISLTALKQLRPQQVVIDIIYSPICTPLLQIAQQQGCHTFNGIGMLVHQAAQSFEEWTQQKMPIDLITNTINNYLNNKSLNS
ncbi:shikimate dehydrogenase [Bombilactobacillus bombi]|uniref:shikimate dehydrogenase n=1 Tax=Bombilactobacillus bombi TaxID=1303590 RepID=UPI0015E5CD27|nr:shikimate dehydrogenase [Bombilactobacillus bombi]MBA1434554.1 shikimate dehydrogenase [Bombilactobacillus bombi]